MDWFVARRVAQALESLTLLKDPTSSKHNRFCVGCLVSSRKRRWENQCVVPRDGGSTEDTMRSFVEVLRRICVEDCVHKLLQARWILPLLRWRVGLRVHLRHSGGWANERVNDDRRRSSVVLNVQYWSIFYNIIICIQ